VVSCGGTKGPTFSAQLGHVRLVHWAHSGERLVRFRVRARLQVQVGCGASGSGSG
jgi:hypothetical protein